MREEINENFLNFRIEILTNETHIDYKRIKRRKSDDEPKSGYSVNISIERTYMHTPYTFISCELNY